MDMSALNQLNSMQSIFTRIAHTKRRHAGNTKRNTSSPNSISCKVNQAYFMSRPESEPLKKGGLEEDGVDALVIVDRLGCCYADEWSPKYCEPEASTDHKI